MKFKVHVAALVGAGVELEMHEDGNVTVHIMKEPKVSETYMLISEFGPTPPEAEQKALTDCALVFVLSQALQGLRKRLEQNGAVQVFKQPDPDGGAQA